MMTAAAWGLGTALKSSAEVGSKPEAILSLIGNTPLLALPLPEALGGVRVFAKAEWYNPSGSVKARAALSMIRDAEASGRLKPGGTFLDASSGNTAAAYGMIAAASGYRAMLCVPKNANPAIFSLLQAYGATVIRTSPMEGSDGAIREARRLAAEHPEWVYLDQYNNPANRLAHERTTAEEIWAQSGGEVTHFVAGLGTTGTFIGTSARLKALNPQLSAVAVQPASALHGLEGLKHLPTAIVPGIYDDSIPDETLFISTEDAYDSLAWLARHAGIAVGPSSGAAYAACLQLARRLARRPAASEAYIVTVFPDAGERYIAEGLIGRS